MKLINISKIYNQGKGNEKAAIKNVNLSFLKKGLVFIVGKSGSGKSTLLNILAGLDLPTEGSIFDGKYEITKLSVDKLNEYRRSNIGFIFQNYGLLNQLTVKDNIFLGEAITNDKLRKCREILEVLDLTDVFDKPVIQLSGGQQQRVSIARALIKESQIIIGDEPTGNLDHQNGKAVFEALKKISENCLVIVVTHDMDSAQKYGDRIITITDGEVVADTGKIDDDVPLGVEGEKNRKCSLSFKDAYRKSRQLNRGKNKKMLICTCISVLLIGLFGLSLMFSRFDLAKTSSDFIVGKGENTIPVFKGYVDNETGKFIKNTRVIKDEEIDRLINETGISSAQKRFYLLGMQNSIGETGNVFFPAYINMALCGSADDLRSLNYNIFRGRYPEKPDEIAITDFTAFELSKTRPYLITEKLGLNSVAEISDNDLLRMALKSLDENTKAALFGDEWVSEIEKAESLQMIQDNPGLVLVCSDCDFITNSFYVSGIVDTDFEKFSDLIYKNEAELQEDDRAELFTYNIQEYYNVFYTEHSFIDSVYVDKIFFSNALFGLYSKYAEILRLTKVPEYNEVYFSSNFFRNYFGEEYIEGKEYLFDNTVSQKKGKNMNPDVIFRSDPMKVIGVFDLPRDYQNVLGNGNVIICQDEYFADFSKAQSYIVGINLLLPSDKEEINQLIHKLDEYEMYYALPYSYSLYSIRDLLNLFKGIGVGGFVICFILAVSMVASSFVGRINEQKNEIGIMRAMGMSKTFLAKLYLMGNVTYLLLIPLLSSFLLIFLINIANRIIAKNFAKFYAVNSIVEMKLIRIDAFPFVLIGIVCVIIVVPAIWAALRKISRLSPIDAIRGNNYC